MMRIQRRQFLHMAASAVALPTLSRAAAAQTTGAPPVNASKRPFLELQTRKVREHAPV
jgi:hypothetical protein